MMNSTTQCSDLRLRHLIEGDESNPELRSTLQHVDSCASCQARLEQLAADSDVWQEARDVLTSADGVELAGSDGPANRWRHSHWQRRPVAWNETMARHLLSPPSHPEMLGRIGRYDVERLIGSGGMGVVFKAYDTELNRPVAVKLLAPYLAENGSARKRFAREARAAAAVVDEHVVAIHNVESGDDPQQPPFLVMKYIAGGSLQQRLDRDGPLDVCEILRIGMQTARGLAAAHAQGLIHRDVKPSNILLDEGVERALLTDFGLARAEDDACLTRSGFHPGTPHYMSPEQVRGEAIDGRSDLFSLGCVLYALCTGHPPFRAETSYAVLRRITDDTARPIRELNNNIPEWLERIVMKLLSKSREDRFDSAEQVAELLEECLAHVQHPTTTPLPVSFVPQAASRRSISIVTTKGVMTMLGTLGTTLLGMIVWQATEAPDIGGQWTSDEWGTVVLEAKRPGQYEGTFTGSDKDKPGYDITDIPVITDGEFGSTTVLTETKLGTVELNWSRVERRFNGTWRKGITRSGKMSLRVVDNEIRGAWTTSRVAQKESESPRLADLLWKRMAKTTNEAGGSADKRTGLQTLLDQSEPVMPRSKALNEPLQVARVWLSAALAGDAEATQEIAVKKPAEATEISEFAKRTSTREIALHEVWIDDHDTAQIAIVVSAPITLHETAERSDTAQLVVTLRKRAVATTNQSHWSVDDISFKRGGLEDDRVQFQKEHLQYEMIWGGRKLELTGVSDPQLGEQTAAYDWNRQLPTDASDDSRKQKGNEAAQAVKKLIIAIQQEDIETIKLVAKDSPAAEDNQQDIRELLGETVPDFKATWIADHAAIVFTTPLRTSSEQSNGRQLLFTLTQVDEQWVVDDIDLESGESLQEEIARFKQAHPNADELPTP